MSTSERRHISVSDHEKVEVGGVGDHVVPHRVVTQFLMGSGCVSVLGLVLVRPRGHHLALVDPPRPARPLAVGQCGRPARRVAVPPVDHRRPAHPDPRRDLGVRQALTDQQHDPPAAPARLESPRPTPRTAASVRLMPVAEGDGDGAVHGADENRAYRAAHVVAVWAITCGSVVSCDRACLWVSVDRTAHVAGSMSARFDRTRLACCDVSIGHGDARLQRNGMTCRTGASEPEAGAVVDVPREAVIADVLQLCDGFFRTAAGPAVHAELRASLVSRGLHPATALGWFIDVWSLAASADHSARWGSRAGAGREFHNSDLRCRRRRSGSCAGWYAPRALPGTRELSMPTSKSS